MTSEQLKWTEAKEDDSPSLRSFICADSPPPIRLKKHRKVAGNHWERVVQEGLQNAPIPAPGGDVLLLGWHRDEQLTAVCWTFEVDGPKEVKILGIAVSRARRQQGYGHQILDAIVQRLIERADAAGESTLAIWGWVHERNLGSQALMSAHRFVYLVDADEEGYQEWWLNIEL